MRYGIDYTIASLLVVGFLFFHYLRNGRESKNTSRFFPLAMIYVICLGGLDIAAVLVMDDPASSIDTCFLFCSIYLVAEILAAALFTLYLPLAIYGVTMRERRGLQVLLLPALAIGVLIVFANPGSGMLFTIDATHRYVNGYASFLLQGVYVFYLGLALGISLFNRRRIEPFKFYSILVMVGIGALGMVLQAIFWEARLSVLTYAFIVVEMYLSFLVPEKRFDALTGMYGRRSFAIETHKMLHRHPDVRYAIVYANIKEFKVINVLYGEHMGDYVLSEVGRELKEFVGDDATSCRLHDDRFAFCMPCDELDIAGLLDSTSDVNMRKRFDFNVHLNYGFYIVEDSSTSVAAMCDRARLALDQISESHVSRYSFYRPEQGESFLEEYSIVEDMERSLEESRFEVYLQPIYDLKTSKIAAAEALIRWNHPTRGYLPPSEFIPSFERNGLISKIDGFVWESVCHLQRKRLDSGQHIVPITANVSRADISDKLGSTIAALLQSYRIPAKSVCFEITESIYSENEAVMGDLVEQLHAAGAPVLLDDFGSGYSSLAILEKMPFDYMKIDREFLTDVFDDERSREVAATMIELGSKLKLPTVVEGIETEELSELVKGMGSRYGQGFLFSRPVPIPEFEELLGKERHCTVVAETRLQDIDVLERATPLRLASEA